MKNQLLFIALFLLVGHSARAQCNANVYTRIFKEASALQEMGQFIEAKNKFEAVKIYACNQKEKDAADERVDALFEQIDRLRFRADSIAETNRKQALTAYANDLAYKSTIAMESGDRSTAYNLAAFACQYVIEDNTNVIRALMGAIYPNNQKSVIPWNYNLLETDLSIRQIAFSPDGSKLATIGGGVDPLVKIWDVSTGIQLFSLEGSTWGLHCVAFSPDGKKIAAGGGLNTGSNLSIQTEIFIWDLESKKLIRLLNGHIGTVRAIAFSPDGKTLASGGDDENMAKIWDLESGRVINSLKEHLNNVYSIAFSPDGKLIATGEGDMILGNKNASTLRVWNAENGQVVFSMSGHEDDILGVAFAPDGNKLATVSVDTTIRIWEMTNTQNPIVLKGHTGIIKTLCFSSNGKYLATGSDDKLTIIWDMESGKPKLTLKGQMSGISSVAFAPQIIENSGMPQTIATGSYNGTVKIWDLDSKNTPLIFQDTNTVVLSLSFSPDGQKIATGCMDKTVKIWDLNTGSKLKQLSSQTDNIRTIAYSHDGKSIASGSHDKTVKIWNPDRIADTLTLRDFTDPIRHVAFSPDDKLLSICSSEPFSKNFTATIWDWKNSKKVLTLNGHQNCVRAAQFSPDSIRIATVSEDETTKIWNCKTGESLLTLKGHNGFVNCLAFSPDGKLLATGSADNTVKIWDVENGQEVLALVGHNAEIMSVAFSPNGKWLATGAGDDFGFGFYDSSVRIWDLESGEAFIIFDEKRQGVFSVAFSPDGKKLAAGSLGGGLRIWDLTPEGWKSSAGKNIKLSGLTKYQLEEYKLSGLLRIRAENEEVLKKSKNVFQIMSFAELYAQNTTKSRDLRRSSKEYAQAERLYKYVLELEPDSFYSEKLGVLYGKWASDILLTNRPDTAFKYIHNACQFGVGYTRCLDLEFSFSEKTGRHFDIQPFLNAEKIYELIAYGTYFFNKAKWDEAQLFYEKSIKIKATKESVERLLAIYEKKGQSIDFKSLLSLENNAEIKYYADVYYKNKEWDKAFDLYDKAESIKHELTTLVRLFECSTHLHHTPDVQRFLVANDSFELQIYAELYYENGNEIRSDLDGKIKNYQNGILLREKLLTLDTSQTLRESLADEYCLLAKCNLLVPNALAADLYVGRALELNQANKQAQVIKPFLFLLQNKKEEAKALFKIWSSKPYGEDDITDYRSAFLGLLKFLEDNEIEEIEYETVRNWLK